MSISQIRKERKCIQYTISPILHLFLFSGVKSTSNKEFIQEEQAIHVTNELRQEEQGKTGDYELSKEAGSRKSLWVHFLVCVKKIRFLCRKMCEEFLFLTVLANSFCQISSTSLESHHLKINVLHALQPVSRDPQRYILK